MANRGHGDVHDGLTIPIADVVLHGGVEKVLVIVEKLPNNALLGRTSMESMT